MILTPFGYIIVFLRLRKANLLKAGLFYQNREPPEIQVSQSDRNTRTVTPGLKLKVPEGTA
jgi:hypothetical protein